MKIIKNETIEAEIFLNCGGDKCDALRHALLERIPSVNSAQTVKTIGGDISFCVTGKAIIKKDSIAQLKDEIEQLKSLLNQEGIHIKDSKILLAKE